MNILEYLIDDLLQMLLEYDDQLSFYSCDDVKAANLGYSQKYKDIIIGILLNIACNIDDEEFIEFLCKKSLLNILTM